MRIDYDVKELESGLKLKYWSQSRFFKAIEDEVALNVLANACRLNILSMIKAAGSGHIGTSFSSVEILISVRQYLSATNNLRRSSQQKGVFFSSKGHDAPAIYAVMHLLGEISDDQLFTLRRLEGLPGHPEIETPGIPTNTGSLGMGISKAKGFVHANRMLGLDEKVVVLLGDGELQEGQIWESLPTAARDKMSELIVIVDGNKIQSDTWVEEISPLGNLKMRVEGSGWNFISCDGHNISAILENLFKSGQDAKPTFIYASTIKGCGVGFMTELSATGKFYKFHSGSVPDDLYEDACEELQVRIGQNIHCALDLKIRPRIEFDSNGKLRTELDHSLPKERPDSFISKWADFLCKAMSSDERVVILDADLSYDTGTYLAREIYPSRYIQAGIAEQDMVSMAGTLALKGKIPIVHSFATFLTMRPTEQIFNNATEKTSVVYVGFLAGLLPSPPGFSHQAVTDVGIMASIPGMLLIEPACEFEMEKAYAEALNHKGPTYIRMVSLGSIPTAVGINSLGPGDMTARAEGTEIAIVCSGPLLAEQAVKAAMLLGENVCAVFTYPFLNSPPSQRTLTSLRKFRKVVILENYNSGLGIHKEISAAVEKEFELISVDVPGIPRSGWNDEVLRFHKLDAESIAEKIRTR